MTLQNGLRVLKGSLICSFLMLVLGCRSAQNSVTHFEQPGRPVIDLDANGDIIESDTAIKNTYSLPDIDAVTFYNATHREQHVGIGVEIYEVKPFHFGAWKIANVGTSENTYFFYSTYRFTSILEVSGGPFIGYNWRPSDADRDPGFYLGLGFTISKF